MTDERLPENLTYGRRVPVELPFVSSKVVGQFSICFEIHNVPYTVF